MKSFLKWLESAPVVVGYDINRVVDAVAEELPVPRHSLEELAHQLLPKNSHLDEAGMIKLLKAKIKNWLPDWGSGSQGRPPWVTQKLGQISREQ